MEGNYIVNKSAYYFDLQILKVWDVYIQTKKLGYWIPDSEDTYTLFNEMNLVKEAGIVIDLQGKLYLNDERRSISICGPVNYISLKELTTINNITHALDVALKQIKLKKSMLNSLLNHTILFPYHIMEAHWVLGALDLNFGENGNLIPIPDKKGNLILKFYNPSHIYGGTEIKPSVKEAIENLLRDIFDKNLKLQCIGEITNQQNDGSTCGVITAENGKGMIDGKLSEKLKIKYPQGTEDLRKKHLDEVKCPRFYEMQKTNEYWRNPEIVINDEELEKMISELKNSHYYENENFFQQKNDIELGLFVKGELEKEENFTEHPFWKLLMEEDKKKGFKFRERMNNTLWAAKQHLEMGHKKEDEKTEIDVNFQSIQIKTKLKREFEVSTQTNKESVAKGVFVDKKQKLKLTTGISPETFRELVTKDVFVDKSLFIEEIIPASAANILITRPRRWGKTLNMQMLQTFLEIEVDEVGKKMVKPNNHRYFDGSIKDHLFKIWNESEIDTDKIADLIWQSADNNFKYNFSADDINNLIKSLENSDDESWLKIKDEIMKKQKSNNYTFDELIELEKIGKNHYGALINPFHSLFNFVHKTKQKIEKHSDCEAFLDLRKKITEKIINWKMNDSQEDKKNYELMNRQFSFLTNYFGKYPVIFITFSGIEKDKDNDDIFSAIKTSLSRAFESHMYIYRKLLITCIEDFKSFQNENELFNWNDSVGPLKNKLEDLIRKYNKTYKSESPEYRNMVRFGRICFDEGELATLKDLRSSIYFLSKLLHQHFGMKVFVLIDEYDAPMNNLTSDLVSLKRVTNFMSEMFKDGLKNNEHIEKAIITGILKIANADLFSGLNSFAEYGVLDDKFARYFGFTNEEINDLLDKNLEFSSMEEKNLQKAAIKDWYNGYIIGDLNLYNPWSIMNCLETSEIGPYWVDSGNTELLELVFAKFLKKPGNFAKFENLMKHEYYELPQNEIINMKINLKDILNPYDDNFWPLMLSSGYLTRDKNYENKFRLPNKEVKSVLSKILWKIWFKEKFPNFLGVDGLLSDYAKSLEKKEEYEQFFTSNILTRLDAGEKTEADFQILLCGIASLSSIYGYSNHKVCAEVSVTWKNKVIGRIDSVTLPKTKNPESTTANVMTFLETSIPESTTVYLDEIKKTEKSDEKEKKAEEAFWQIYAKRYISHVLKLYDDHKHNQKWTDIVIRAIVFYKDASSGKWSVMIKEFIHSIEIARKIDNIFKNFENREDLTNEKNQNIAVEARNHFLGNFENIEKFLSVHNDKGKPTNKEGKPENEKDEEGKPKKKPENKKITKSAKRKYDEIKPKNKIPRSDKRNYDKIIPKPNNSTFTMELRNKK